jgi:8-amino-7-oxononanoate synthase
MSGVLHHSVVTSPLPVEERITRELEQLVGRGRYRTIPSTGRRQGRHIMVDGRSLLNLSSNDYLGLGTDTALYNGFGGQLFAGSPGDDGRYALTSSSSRLLTGNHPVADELESTIAEAYGRESALVFNSGYHANTGILAALSTRHDLILSDRLNHASIIDGIRIADAEYQRFRHADYEHLEALLEKAAARYHQIFIVTESVFSMDGDLADLRRLVALKHRYQAMLIVDEAHGAGVFGKHGLGLCEREGVMQEVDMIVGTFGKAFASTGAYAVMRSLFREYLVNTMRTLIFTTSLPPLVHSWSLMTFRKQLGMTTQREHLALLAAGLRQSLQDAGFNVPGASQIVPVVLGDDHRAVAVAAALRDAGFHALPVRPPTVPENSARLRFSLRADLSADDLADLAVTIKRINA